MMNKAQKKVIEAQVIEYAYTRAYEQKESCIEYAQSSKAELDELIAEGDEEKTWRISTLEERIEEYTVKAEAFGKLAEQLLKLM